MSHTNHSTYLSKQSSIEIIQTIFCYNKSLKVTNTFSTFLLLGHDVQSRATFTSHMKPDGSWLGHAHAGAIFCAERVATYKCDGVGNMTEAGDVSFRGGAIFETTSEALSELNGKYYMFTYESDAEGKSDWNL